MRFTTFAPLCLCVRPGAARRPRTSAAVRAKYGWNSHGGTKAQRFTWVAVLIVERLSNRFPKQLGRLLYHAHHQRSALTRFTTFAPLCLCVRPGAARRPRTSAAVRAKYGWNSHGGTKAQRFTWVAVLIVERLSNRFPKQLGRLLCHAHHQRSALMRFVPLCLCVRLGTAPLRRISATVRPLRADRRQRFL